jgi:hypothetical protein
MIDAWIDEEDEIPSYEDDAQDIYPCDCYFYYRQNNLCAVCTESKECV